MNSDDVLQFLMEVHNTFPLPVYTDKSRGDFKGTHSLTIDKGGELMLNLWLRKKDDLIYNRSVSMQGKTLEYATLLAIKPTLHEEGFAV